MAFWIAPALADKRVALVIGNGAYQKVAKLPNPTRDAAAVGSLFRAVGFDTVEVKSDLDQAALRRALRDFSDAVRDADIAVVFFAGHGIEVGGTNYLIPVDAALERDIDVADETVSLDRVGEILEPAKRLRLVILDACRDNPFASGIRRTMANRSIGRGLARVDIAAADSMVAFAAKPGSTAADGTGANSPYTAALLKHLATPGLDLRLAMGRVRDEVLAATGRRQEPIVFTSLGGAELALVPGKPGTAVAPPADPAAQAWAGVKDTTSVAMLEAYRRQYPNSVFDPLAAARLGELKGSQVAVAAPPSRPAAPPTPVQPAVGVFPPSPGVNPLSAERERGLKPKDTFKECDACPEMVVVPAGSFTMGSPASEKYRDNNEGPQHTVTFAKSFAVGKLAVTVDQFAAFVKATGHDAGAKCYTYENNKTLERSGRSWRNPGFPQNGGYPAACLNWDDAKAYVGWLNKTTGKTYRLLSESEREYATRAGTRTPFWWGSTISTDQANYSGDHNGDLNYGSGRGLQKRKRTTPAHSFQPNPFGLYQVHGNVTEWTEDCYHDSYNGAPTDGSAWTTGDCSSRVFRGGSWGGDPWYLRAASRFGSNPVYRSSEYGFRVARTLTP